MKELIKNMETITIKIHKDTEKGMKLIEVWQVKMILVELQKRINHGLFIEKAKEMNGIDFEELEKIQKVANEQIDNIILKLAEIELE